MKKRRHGVSLDTLQQQQQLQHLKTHGYMNLTEYDGWFTPKNGPVVVKKKNDRWKVVLGWKK